MHVSKWGNSLALRIPAELAEKLDLKAGDSVNLELWEPKGFLVQKQITREEAIETVLRGGLKLPPDYKFDREEANARPALSRY
jgi:antitoxin MazE